MLHSLTAEIALKIDEQFEEKRLDRYIKIKDLPEKIWLFLRKADFYIEQYEKPALIDPTESKDKDLSYKAYNQLRKGLYKFQIEEKMNEALSYFEKSLEYSKGSNLRALVWMIKVY